MGFLLFDRRSLTMLLILSELIFWLPNLKSEETLDSLLQDYAFRAFVRPKTGIVYNGSVPSNLTGIKISALRLRSGSLWARGVETYNEFEIPKGIIVEPYVERIVLVYQNLANWSASYYSLTGYTHLVPVLGLLAYDASNLSAKNLPELFIRSSGEKPISIRFQNVGLVPDGSVAMCVWFDLQGRVNFSNVELGNTCLVSQQGHFSIVANYTDVRQIRTKNSKATWLIVGSVLGGVVLVVVMVLVVMWIRKYMVKKKMGRMEREAEVGEALSMKSVGNVKAPSAMGTRTQPAIEHDYVP
ncbi:uncharacterized protein LOC124945522 [Impatiens glandulifera]|uniref:uncharacterized protein LOC124945522 n=1 Tax=Impatiens glandulifera TaxID=253017 RepID=UPI001FB19E5B|nr:uncharacterized protein LOC124945522 [Impatiens glandulifera]XP_047341931.1 uncharacterized protein LOC124945522 [Impatiens glandulifera]